MMASKRYSFQFLVISVIITSFLGGCLSLAEDVTPIPGESQPTSSIQGTDLPTLEPTQEPDVVEEPEVDLVTGDSIVNVFLVDQTSEGLLEQDLQIRLEGYDGFELVFEQSLPITNTNPVQFGEIDLTPGRVYFASLAYGGAVYRSEIVQISPDQTFLDLELIVYDTTTDQSALVIDRLHILFDFLETGSVRVVEIYIISNLGDSTVVPGSDSGISVEFPLPDGAFGIEFEDGSLGQRYRETRTGFGDTVSIPPGSGVYPLSVIYQLPYTKNKLDFNQVFDLPVGAVILMTPADGFKLKGATVEDQGLQAMPSGEVQIYSASSIPAGETLEFRISGKPGNGLVPEPSMITTSQLIIYGAGGAGVLLLASGIWLFLRNQRQIEDEEIDTYDNKEEILDSIIALDDLFSAGEISEGDYKRKRSQLKSQLKSLSEK